MSRLRCHMVPPHIGRHHKKSLLYLNDERRFAATYCDTNILPQNMMKKRLCFLLGVLLLCFSLTNCSTESPDKDMEEEPFDIDQTATDSNKNNEEQVSWESFLASIQAEDIGYPSWSVNRTNPTDEELAQYLQNTASCQTDYSADRFGDIIWTLYMYVDAPPEDELDAKHQLSLEAGFQENLVGIWGGSALPDGKIYVDDSELYWLVRSINDTDAYIDQDALSAYQATIDQYIAKEQSRINNPAITVELLSVKERVDRSDIGVKVYTIGTVWTSDTPEALLKSMAGGSYIDSELRLHPDGKSSMSYMLVIDKTPVGFLTWEALEEIESQDFTSGEELLNSIKDNTGSFSPI